MAMDIPSVSSAISPVKTDTYYSAESIKKDVTKEVAESAAKTEDVGATYEKGNVSGKATYSANKMTKEERSALVSQLQADAEARKSQFLDLVEKTVTGQVGSLSKATGDDVWQLLASGNFTVDAATKTQAQKDISEDGYWGVKQTSQRLFDFAQALAGDDVEKMKSMQDAMQKGFDKATKTWGKELPDISQKTLDAANKLFEDYFAAKAEG